MVRIGKKEIEYFKFYELTTRNCQWFACALLEDILCTNQAHAHDQYLWSQFIDEQGFLREIRIAFLLHGLVHDSAIIGLVFATVGA